MNIPRLSVSLTLACSALLSGCAIEPWVKPYDRERLADPIMKFSRDALAARMVEILATVGRR